MYHVLVTTDLSDESRVAFPVAKEQCELRGIDTCKITLLAVTEDVAPVNIAFGYGFAIAETQGIQEKLHARYIDKVEELVRDEFEGMQVSGHALNGGGPVYDQILAYVEQNQVDLLVIATHGRTGFKRLCLGSVAERVIRQAPCPVLVVPCDLADSERKV